MTNRTRCQTLNIYQFIFKYVIPILKRRNAGTTLGNGWWVKSTSTNKVNRWWFEVRTWEHYFLKQWTLAYRNFTMIIQNESSLLSNISFRSSNQCFSSACVLHIMSLVESFFVKSFMCKIHLSILTWVLSQNSNFDLFTIIHISYCHPSSVFTLLFVTLIYSTSIHSNRVSFQVLTYVLTDSVLITPSEIFRISLIRPGLLSMF